MKNDNGWITLTHYSVKAEGMASGLVNGEIGSAVGPASFFLSDVRSVVDQPWGGAEISVHNLHRLQITEDDADALRLAKIEALKMKLTEAACA